MHRFRNKVCLIGESGVGKSSLLSLLQGRDVLSERNPTVGLEIEVALSKHLGKMSVWDFGGQERFKFMWEDFLRGAGLTILVTDSSEKNVDKTKKEIIERFSRYIGSKIIAIANKQDLPDSLTEAEVQKRLGGIKTYGMSAIRPELRERMQQIIEYEMEEE